MYNMPRGRCATGMSRLLGWQDFAGGAPAIRGVRAAVVDGARRVDMPRIVRARTSRRPQPHADGACSAGHVVTNENRVRTVLLEFAR